MADINVVLAPGILGFAPVDPLHYFKGVAAHLETTFPGLHVLEAETAPLGSVVHRSKRLADQIRSRFPEGSPVHIIAHSMGGLDARHLMRTNADLAKRIPTVIMIGTPHLGSPVADLANAASVLKLIPGQNALLTWLHAHGDAVADLSEKAAESRKVGWEDVHDRYFNIVGTGRPKGDRTSLFFELTHTYILAKRGRNDGIVPYSSATRGSKPHAEWPGDHADLIGHNLDKPLSPAFDHLSAYADLVRELILPVVV